MKPLPLTLSALSVLAPLTNAQAANEVKFLEVQSVEVWNYIPRIQTRIEAVVANLGATKQVNARIHYKTGAWVDQPLSYNRPGANGTEIWSAQFFADPDSYYNNVLSFALNYSVNGQTYWDNNGNANYSIAADGGVMLASGTNVYNGPYAPGAVYAAGPGGGVVSGYVSLKNLGADKKVTVVFSTDGWKTTQSAGASYAANFWTAGGISTVPNPNAAGFEEWTYALPVTGTDTRVDYAIAYTVNGRTYWDNNFGQNYSVTITH